MIYYLRNARNILSHHPDGFAFPFVADCAPYFGHSAAHYHVEARFWRPGLFGQLSYNLFSRGLVIRTRWLHFLCKSRQRLNKIGATDDANNFLSAGHRHALDATVFHNLHDIFQRCVL